MILSLKKAYFSKLTIFYKVWSKVHGVEKPESIGGFSQFSSSILLPKAPIPIPIPTNTNTNTDTNAHQYQYHPIPYGTGIVTSLSSPSRKNFYSCLTIEKTHGNLFFSAAPGFDHTYQMSNFLSSHKTFFMFRHSSTASNVGWRRLSDVINHLTSLNTGSGLESWSKFDYHIKYFSRFSSRSTWIFEKQVSLIILSINSSFSFLDQLGSSSIKWVWLS